MQQERIKKPQLIVVPTGGKGKVLEDLGVFKGERKKEKGMTDRDKLTKIGGGGGFEEGRWKEAMGEAAKKRDYDH